MDEAAIRAKAKKICSEMRTVDYFYTEADGVLADRLTQLWNEAVEAAATAYCGEYDKAMGVSMLEFKIQQIRRLRIESEEKVETVNQTSTRQGF